MRRVQLKEVLRRKMNSREEINSSLPDYHYDTRTRRQKLIAVLISVACTFLLALFFYKNIFAALFLIPVGVLVYKELRVKSIKENRIVLEKQFKECILSVSTALKAGYAIENAFILSEKDMTMLCGESAVIVKELQIIKRGLRMNIPLEDMLEDLARRSGSENIERFSSVFQIAKKAGGNMPEIIRNSSELIGKDIDTRSEIQTVLSGRRMEQNIMRIMPFAIVVYISLTSRGYFDSLYGNLKGILVMTGCLAIYLLAVFWGNRIMNKIEEGL